MMLLQTNYSNNPVIFEYKNGWVSIQINGIINITADKTIDILNDIPVKYRPKELHRIDVINPAKTSLRFSVGSDGVLSVYCYETTEGTGNNQVLFAYPS